MKYLMLGSAILFSLISPLTYSFDKNDDPTTYRLSPADIVSVYDGDTFKVNLKGLPRFFGYEIPIRIKNIDTPEIRSRCNNSSGKAKENELAIVARDVLEKELLFSNVIELRNIERGSFFRLIADVYVDGKYVNDVLIEQGVGVSVNDGHQFNWCSFLSDSINHDQAFP